MEMPDHRHVGGDARGGFVERSEVMQVQDVGGVGPRLAQDACPGGDEMLVGGVVDGGENPVGRVRAVLVGRVQGGVSAQRIGGRGGSGVVGGGGGEATGELGGVARAAGDPGGGGRDGY